MHSEPIIQGVTFLAKTANPGTNLGDLHEMKFVNLKENVSLVANLGVLLGIVFLITEINQANRIATNEAETNLSIMGNELNRNVQSSADFMVKLTSSESQLTEAEEIKLASITLEHFNTWGAASTAYRNGLISEFLFETWMGGLELTLSTYPKIAEQIANDFDGRFKNIEEGESALIDHLRLVLTTEGLLH